MITGILKSDPTFDPNNFRRATALKNAGSEIMYWPILFHLDVLRLCNLPS